jgi:hypothetical protein
MPSLAGTTSPRDGRSFARPFRAALALPKEPAAKPSTELSARVVATGRVVRSTVTAIRDALVGGGAERGELCVKLAPAFRREQACPAAGPRAHFSPQGQEHVLRCARSSY